MITAVMIIAGVALIAWPMLPKRASSVSASVASVQNLELPKPKNYVPSPTDAFHALGMVRDRYVACGASEDEVKQLLSIAPVLMQKESKSGSV